MLFRCNKKWAYCITSFGPPSLVVDVNHNFVNVHHKKTAFIAYMALEKEKENTRNDQQAGLTGVQFANTIFKCFRIGTNPMINLLTIMEEEKSRHCCNSLVPSKILRLHSHCQYKYIPIAHSKLLTGLSSISTDRKVMPGYFWECFLNSAPMYWHISKVYMLNENNSC